MTRTRLVTIKNVIGKSRSSRNKYDVVFYKSRIFSKEFPTRAKRSPSLNPLSVIPPLILLSFPREKRDRSAKSGCHGRSEPALSRDQLREDDCVTFSDTEDDGTFLSQRTEKLTSHRRQGCFGNLEALRSRACDAKPGARSRFYLCRITLSAQPWIPRSRLITFGKRVKPDTRAHTLMHAQAT